jgi:hypothetical protein
MASFSFFQKNDQIQIVNSLSPFYSELAKIVDIRSDYYFVRLQDGIVIRVNFEDISPWFKTKDERILYRAQLFQMQLLAVDSNDPQWFYQICEMINKIKDDKVLLLPTTTGLTTNVQ